jgi:uncharacterized protein YpmB
MSEKIKQGIEAAQTDLVKEKALKEQEEVRGEGEGEVHRWDVRSEG